MAFAIGDLVTRAGDDLQRVLQADEELVTVVCVKAPASGWCKVGDEEINLTRRYTLVSSDKAHCFMWGKEGADDLGWTYRLRIYTSNGFAVNCMRAFTKWTPRHLIAQELRMWHRSLWREARGFLPTCQVFHNPP